MKPVAVALLLLLASVAGRVSAAGDVTLALKPYFRDLKFVEARAGARTVSLLVDTGGGVTAIAPEVAAALGCAPHGRDVGHRMTGEAVEFQRCERATLTVGPWSRAFSPIGVFDIAALLPKELPRLDGVLALDAFRGRVITLDWTAGTLVIHDRARESRAAASALPFRPATGETGRFLSAFVPIDGRRGPLWFLLDSGNLRGTIVAKGVLDDGLLPAAGEGHATIAIGTRTPIAMPVTPDELAIDGALGTDFFMRGPVTLDLRIR